MTERPPQEGPKRQPSQPDLPLDRQQTQAGGGQQPDPGFQITVPGYSSLLELHRGGQGVVYRALQESTKRTVAIKVLREGPHAATSARKRFQREVEIVARLEHPNIVSIFDSGRTPDFHPYFVMEYVRGMELDRHVREKELGMEETLRLYRIVLDAVHYAHLKGVIHRDLKPSNILVDQEGHPKLVDFGLARVLVGPVDSVASVTGQVLGTMAYMSPEQVRAKPEEIDARTDVYSLGVILYEIVTGESPYPASSQIMEILHHITESPPTLPAKAWNSSAGITRRSERHRSDSTKCPIDGDLETILLKAIAKERARRYRSAKSFADDIARYLEGSPIEARRDSGIYLMKKSLERHRRGVILSVATAFAFVAVFLAASRFRNPAPEPLDESVVARFEAAESEYSQVRQELMSTIESRVAAGDVQISALTEESLHIVQDAIEELRVALEKDPSNLGLRDLLLKTYQREIDLLRRMCALPPGT